MRPGLGIPNKHLGKADAGRSHPHTGNLHHILLVIFIPFPCFQFYIQTLFMHFLLKNKMLAILVCLEVMGIEKFYINHTGDLFLVDKYLEST